MPHGWTCSRGGDERKSGSEEAKDFLESGSTPLIHAIMNIIRCPWCCTDPLYVQYHDSEWGRPVHDDAKLFEFLTLE